jgi:hypothetical protein
MKLLETVDDIILSEAIKSLEMVRKYEDYTKKPYVVEQVNAIFEKLKTLDNFIGTNRNGKRLYFTTDYEGKEPESVMDNTTYNRVDYELERANFNINKDFYKNGYAEDRSGRQIRIGKVLNMIIKKEESEERKEHLKNLLQQYNQDPVRLQGQMTKKKKLIVMSTANYDIAGMTQGRSWEKDSCMRLDNAYGQGGTYVHCDILFGTIVVYLINEDDRNIENPLGRTLVKPFINVKNGSDVYYAADPKEYGGQTGFNKMINEIFVDLQQGREGDFKLHPRLSVQGNGRITLKKPIKIIDQSFVDNRMNDSTFNDKDKYVFINGYDSDTQNITLVNKIDLSSNVLFYVDGLNKLRVIDDVECETFSVANSNNLTDIKNLYITNRFTINKCSSVKNISGTFLSYFEVERMTISSSMNLIDVITSKITFDQCSIWSMPQISPRLRTIIFDRCNMEIQELPENIGNGKLNIIFRGTDSSLLPKIPENKNYTVTIR